MKPNRLGQFEDVKRILDSALAASGGEFELPTHGKAVHWRQRAYTFRKLYAEALGGVSPYDTLTLRRIDGESCVVRIDVIKTDGIFRPAGMPAKPQPSIDPADPLLDDAIALRNSLNFGDL